MQSLDGRDDLRELQAQRGESLRLLGTDRVGGDGCGCGWDGVDARGGRELRALATCHCGDDTTASGTLTFNPSETAKTIAVSIAGDSLVEADEPFFVTLSGASGAGIAVAKATDTIVNDDGLTAAKIAAFATVGSFSIDDGDADESLLQKSRR